MDDCIELARVFGERIATRFELPVFLYANAATRPERVKLADVRRGQYEGLKDEIEEPGRAPDFGPPRLHPSAGAVAVGARPFLIAYNINLASKDVELAKRIARRVRELGGGLPKVQANGFWIEELGRAQVSMNILDFGVTPLWLVWETVRDVAAEDGVELAESELIGLAPLAAFLAVADRVDAPTGGPGRAPPGRGRRLPPTARLLPDAGPRTAARSRARRRPTAMSGGPFRLIHGGRSEEPTPGLLIVGASEVVTLAGGVRMGERQGDVGRLSAADVGGPDAPDAPVVACWEGRIAAVGPRAALETALEAEGYQLGRFARLDAGGGSVTPGLVDPHTHLLFAGSREGEWQLRQQGAGYLEILEAGGGILSTVAATREASLEALLAHGRRWLDEMLGHGVTTIEAKSGYGLDLETEIRLIDAAHQLGREGPIDIVPTYLGAHAVPPEFRSRPEGTEAYVRSVIEEQLPGVAAHGRAGSATSSARTACSARTSRAGSCWRRRATGWRLRLHADELAPSGGAELAAEIGAASADHLATPSEAGIDALGGGRRRGPAGRRDRSAGDDLVPDEGPRRAGPDVHRPRHPGRHRHRFQPGHLADGEPAAGDDRGLPRARADARRGAQRRDDQRGPGDRARGGDRFARTGQERGPRHLARPELEPDPVLAGRRPGADRHQARARRPRPGLTAAREPSGLLAARFEEDRRRLDRQARRGDRQLRLGDRPRCPSRGRSA